MATFAYNIVCQSRKVADVADLAQLVEQLIRNEQVVGSSPIISSIEDYGSAFAEPFCCANCSLSMLLRDYF